MKLIPITHESPESDEIRSADSTVQEVVVGTRQMYSGSSCQPPWVGYLASLDENWVGTCAFKSPPQANRVEIAYFTFPEFENKGFATQMVGLLIGIAEQESHSLIITAQTMPEANASTRILEKHGFRRTGEYDHPEDGLVWQWERNAIPAAPLG